MSENTKSYVNNTKMRKKLCNRILIDHYSFDFLLNKVIVIENGFNFFYRPYFVTLFCFEIYFKNK